MNIRKTMLGACFVLGLTAISSVPVVIAAEEEQVVIEDLSVPELRAEIEKIQAEFYRVFNTLNENDDFDVEGQQFTPTGSNIPQLGCEPKFVSKRRGANANDYRLGTDELISNDALIKELQPEFEQLTAMMNEFASQNEYFGELGQILQMLRGRLNELSQ